MIGAVVIYLPVRNGGTYLSAAIDSIRAQTDPDWWLVVLDNKSTDDTVARVEAADDRRIALHQADAVLSITESWARILPLAAAMPGDQLLSFIGHDDLLRPDFVATVKRLAAEDTRATLYQTHFDLIDAAGDVLRPCRPMPERESWQDMLAALCWGIRESYGTGYAFRAADYVRVGGIPGLPRLLYADHLLFTRLTRLGHKRCATSSACAYRLHAGSASNDVTNALLAAQITALDDFITAVDEEMAAFVATPRGHDALAAAIGRQLALYDLPVIVRTLDAATVLRLKRLRARYDELAPRIPPQAWSGSTTSRWRNRLERVIRTTAFVARRTRRQLRR